MEIYVLFTCDVWKGYSSMRIRGASKKLSKIKSELKKMIKSKEAKFNGDRFLIKDKWSVKELNDAFDYIYIEQLEDGSFN